MSVILGINSVFHDPAAALVVDGVTVAAAEEERFNRRKHGHDNVPFAAWEVPAQAARWCLAQAGLSAEDLDAVACSFDPTRCPNYDSVLDGTWEGLRTLYARRTPLLLQSALPGLDPGIVQLLPHHVTHAASAYLASGWSDCAVMTLDGRGERTSHLAGRVRDGDLEVLAEQSLPHSLGLFYEDVTEHLGFRRSSDEYKVMALASYGTPRWLEEFRQLLRTDGTGGFVVEPIEWGSYVKRGAGALHRVEGDGVDPDSADLAATVQVRLQEVLLELAGWLHEATGDTRLCLAGGVALNCVANSVLWRDSPFDEVWVQPAAGDSGTALGGALYLAHAAGDTVAPMHTAALGRGFTDDEIEAQLRRAQVPYTRPADIAETVADCLAADGVVAWFQGRAEYGPRALGHRSLLAHPGHAANLERINDVKGREQFRPVAPMVLAARAVEIFDGGPMPSPFMLFTHGVHEAWRERLPVITHVDGSARVQTVDPADEPLVAAMLEHFERLTGLPVVVNTSLNTAGRPIVDSPFDALECFGSGPIDLLAIGPFAVHRRRD